MKSSESLLPFGAMMGKRTIGKAGQARPLAIVPGEAAIELASESITGKNSIQGSSAGRVRCGDSVEFAMPRA
jgi:hypothetical protein